MPRLGDASRKNYKLLIDAGYGLAALKALVDDLETRLTAQRALNLDNLDGKITDIEGTGFVKDTHSLVQLQALVDDLETRLSSTRAGYLDNLNNSGLLKANKYAWKKQPIAIKEMAPPTLNEWHTILDTTEDVRALFISLVQTNTETGAKNVNIKITIDGITLTKATDLSAIHATYYYAYIGSNVDALAIITTFVLPCYYYPLEGQSMKVEMRITSALGTAQTLYGYVQYETLEAT